MDEAEKLLCTLYSLDDREVTGHTAAYLLGMKASGVTVRRDRSRKKQYVEIKLFRVLPLPESEAA